MVRRAYRAFSLLVLLVALCASLQAQTGKTIKIRVFDGKTGDVIKPSNVQIRLDRQPSSDNQWVRQNDDGSTSITVPPGSADIMVRATYDNSTEYYVNCDAAKERDTSAEHWYPISAILSEGVVMPNNCVKPQVAAKVTVEPKPGEFDIFVRRRKWREQE
ncbi:MAG: hypothetical protein KGM96_03960 [Acidobacteriota bacterium]|nr:hypothetical protein [Acidobacteriota bacterium]